MGPAFLRKYNTLLVAGTTAIQIPIIKRGVVDFAVGADWTPAAGDVKVSKDGGAAANITNLPTAIAMGNTAYWQFILTAAELSAANVVVTISDSATKAVEDQCFLVETFGNASAFYQADLSAANLPANVIQWTSTNVATPDTAGYPKVTIKSGTGTGEINLTSGRADSNLTYIAGSALSTSTAQLGVNVVNYGGNAGTFSGGRPEVNTTHWGGTAVGSANVRANLVQILGTAPTEGGAGRLAGSFTTLFDVASPVLTVASVNQTGDSYTRIGATGSGLTSLAPSSTALSTAQWSNTRAGYLDNLSGGAVALAAGVNVTQWLGTACATPTVAGVPEVDITHVNGTPAAATAGAIDANVTKWNGTTVATPATAGIPDVNIKNINNATAATPGASGGLLIAGSNAATTLASLTVTTTTTFTGAVTCGDSFTISKGMTIDANPSGTHNGLSISGANGGAGLSLSGGATGYALSLASDATVIYCDGNVVTTGTTTFTGLVTMTAGLAADITGDVTGDISGSVGSVTTKTGYKLASDGLDSISTTAPAGVASNFREMLVQLWRRFFRKTTLTSSALLTYADNGTTVVTSQAVSDDGTTETQGAAT